MSRVQGSKSAPGSMASPKKAADERSPRSLQGLKEVKGDTRNPMAKSLVSSRKSVKSQRLTKAFQAELEVMDQEDELIRLQTEREIQQAKQKLKRLELKKEYAEKMAQLEDDDGSNESEVEDPVDIGLPQETKEESVRRFLDSQPAEETVLPQQPTACPPTTSGQQGMEMMANSMAQMANAILQQNMSTQRLAVSSQLPKLEVPLFDGDPLRYPLWNNAFSSLVDTKPLDAAVKLNYLNTYVTGAPKKVVEHYLLLGTDEAYLKARHLLSRRYGSTSVVSAAFTKRLAEWPKISDRDAAGMRSFGDFLEQVVAAKATVDTLGILDYPQENVKMLEKLPVYLERQWREEIDRWQTHGYGSYPPFTRFVEFVRKAADKANIPELQSIRRSDFKTWQSSPKAKGKSPSGRSFATNASPKKDNGVYSSCPYCGKAHHLDDCEKFKAKPMYARKGFFFQKRLCMGCGLATNHRVKECTQRRTCKECKGNHLTSLHRPPEATRSPETSDQPSETSPQQTEEGSSKCTNVCSIPDQDGREHCMIVPVWVRHSKDPSRECLQYAILDDQSNVGFMSKTLSEKLQVEGTQTNLLLTTMHQSTHVGSRKIEGIEVLDFKKEHLVNLPTCYMRDEIPAKRSQIPKGEVLRKWPHLAPIADELMPYNPAIEVSLLIGNNCARAIRPREVVCGGEDDPYAVKSLLGWGVVGTVCQDASVPAKDRICNKIHSTENYQHFAFTNKAKEVFTTDKVIKALERDFTDISAKGEPYSVEEKQFLDILEKGIRKREDGHYEMPLPMKSRQSSLPNNKPLVIKRWNQLRARFQKNPKFFDDYQEFMKDVISNHAEIVPEEELRTQQRVNYIPHTGVYHPRKPDKIRVVFDCSASYQGVSLNDHLLQGPNLMNSLVGVLCRFRKEAVAFAVDVQSMFHQFFVAQEDRDLLRFLWWKNGDPRKEVVEYRMKVHLFGAASSPGVATFGLRQAADDGEDDFGTEAADFIRKDFYVDDGLRSEPSSAAAIQLLKGSQEICAKAGLKLHKIVSNKREVLKAFPADERAKDIQNLDLDKDPLSLERVLGVVWRVENDVFNFIVEIKDRPFTRRGVLSTVSAFYDPCGFLGPVMLKGKQILQELCRSKLDWDTPMPDELCNQWQKWLNDVRELENLQIARCYKPENLGRVKQLELHHFSDASQDGYGQCTYVRFINEENKAHCAFVMGKSRVTPLRQITIPRLELTAATLSARMSSFLGAELKYGKVEEFFWTDSQVVLGYIQNEAKRFHVYVANRVQVIRDLTNPESWFYVETSANPADDASRGLTAKELTEGCRWLKGPDFLWEDGVFTPNQETVLKPRLEEDDPEVRKVTVLATSGEKTSLPGHFEADRLNRFSGWRRALRAVARCLQLKGRLQRREVRSSASSKDNAIKRSLAPLTVSLLEEAEKAIIRSAQQDYFSEELQMLQELNNKGEFNDRQSARSRNASLKKTSALYRLDPYLDEDGIIRVGGRIDRANLSRDVRHPVILPQRSHVTMLLIQDRHQRVNHMGRGITHNEVRQRGYWVIGGSSAVSHVISRCITCKKMRGALLQQKMSELPQDRLDPAPPFTYCAVDYFGPFLVKEKRSEVKRYGVLFTCLASRSVHLETANSLSGSSFINALRRFLNRRGTVRQIRSDQGTTFVGARHELKDALTEMDQAGVQQYLLENGVEWIPFKFNVPHSSHMGGAWERQILTVRRALDAVLAKQGNQLDDEAFRTFLIEAEGIVNSRPLTVRNLSDHEAPEPLTPQHLLTMKPRVVLPPPGRFQREDLYARKWWRRVQYLADQFWLRWRREYLQELQSRPKWTNTERNLMVGDIVISKENEDARCRWPLARVVDVYPSKDGCVRKVKICMADRLLDSKGKRQRSPTELDRPVHKLVLLISTCDKD